MRSAADAKSDGVVSGLLLDFLFRFVEARGGDAARLAAGIPGGRAALCRRLGWVDWRTYLTVEGRLAEALPGLDAPHYQLGRSLGDAPRLGFVEPVLRAMAGPAPVYRLIPRIIPRFFLRCVEVNLTEDLRRPERIWLQYRFLGGIEPSEAILDTIAGQLEAIPRLFRLPDASVSRRRDGAVVRFSVDGTAAAQESPPLGRWLLDLGRARWLARRNSPQLAEALLATNELLAEKVAALEAANARLAALAEQEQRARQEAEASQQRYQALAETAQDAIYVLDAEGRFEYVNSFTAALASLAPEEMVGHRLVELSSQEVAAVAEHVLPLLFRDGESMRFTHPSSRRRRAWTWYDTHLVPLKDEQGTVTAVLGITRDVTEQRAEATRQAEVVRQQERLQRLDSLGVLAAGIAHDFNNLLAVVAGHADMLEARLGPALQGDPQAHKSLSRIRGATLRARDLCRLLLAQSGDTAAAPRPVHLADWIRGMTGILAAPLPPGVSLSVDIAETLPPVWADPAELGQVLQNLVQNAGEAYAVRAGATETVTLSASMKHLTAEARAALAVPPQGSGRQRWVVLSVQDQGRGIPPEALERVLEPFFSTKAEGRGVGLASVVGIVRRLGGGIGVRSKPGHGTRFDVVLPPWEPNAEAGNASAAAAPRRASTERVLLVDDEPEVREAGEAVLRSLGFEVTPVASANAMIHEIRFGAAGYDAVLLDVTMPGLDGLSALRVLRGTQPDLPVLLVSGVESDAVRAHVGQDPRAAFLQKPYTVQDLDAALTGLLSGGPEP